MTQRNSENDLIKQTRKEKGRDDGGAKGGREAWGSEIAVLLKNGDIEITTNCFQADDCILDAGYRCVPGTGAYEAVLEAHGPLKVGIPHSIRLYSSDEAVINKSFN